MRDLLTAQNELVFKGERLVVPASLCKELMAAVRSSHIGIEGCIRRARDTLYWPRRATKLREYISRCDICLPHRTEQTKEPLLQHDVIARTLVEGHGRSLRAGQPHAAGHRRPLR